MGSYWERSQSGIRNKLIALSAEAGGGLLKKTRSTMSRRTKG